MPAKFPVRLLWSTVQKGRHAIEKWSDPSYDANTWDRCKNQLLPRAGLTLDQVKVVYHKAAVQFSKTLNYPEAGSNYEHFYQQLGIFSSRVPTQFPSVQAIYTTSRGPGYFTTNQSRGEPNSYEQGHALNSWLAEMTDSDGKIGTVWHGWGPYIWAGECGSGLENAAGYCYVRDDYRS